MMADKIDRDARDPKFVPKLTANGKLKGRPKFADMPRMTNVDDGIQTLDFVRFFMARRKNGTQAWAGRIAEQEAEARRLADNDKITTLDKVHSVLAGQPIVSRRRLQISEKDEKRGWNIVSKKKAAIQKFLTKRPAR